MTDIAVRDENNAVAAPTQPSPAMPAMAPSALVQWAFEARQAAQIAESLSKTSFVPASMRGKPGDVTAAILAGQELGLQPMASLRSMDVIQGTPALRAHAMRGLLQSQGHSIQLVESTEAHCTMRGRRKGEAEWQEVTWTLEQAKQLGLLGKDQWKKQPKNMLMARCTGAISRLIAADALYAMPYAAEELGDENGLEAAAPQRSAGRVTSAEILANVPKPVSGPPADRPVSPSPVDTVEPDAEVSVDATAEVVSREQQRRMFALFNDLGYSGDENRQNRLAITAEILELAPDAIESSNDLTAADADLVIAGLETRMAKQQAGA